MSRPAELDRRLLAEAIMWDYEPTWIPPGLEYVERPDVLMWRRNGPRADQRWGNRVAYTRSTPDGIESLIDEVLAFLGGRAFSWVAGASSAPADLAERLAGRGLVDVGDGDLLSARLPVRGLRTADDVDIVEVEDEETARVGIRLAHPNATAEEVADQANEMLAYLALPERRGGFLVAFMDGQPAANAAYRYSSDGRTVYLNGAQTVERFRGRGIYQTLVAYRTDAAVRHGCAYAAIRARRDTSLPILMRRGFADHGHLPIYARPDA